MITNEEKTELAEEIAVMVYKMIQAVPVSNGTPVETPAAPLRKPEEKHIADAATSAMQPLYGMSCEDRAKVVMLILEQNERMSKEENHEDRQRLDYFERRVEFNSRFAAFLGEAKEHLTKIQNVQNNQNSQF